MRNRENSIESPLALVVDDDLTMRLAMRAALKKVGFDVLEAEDGRRAVEIYKEMLPDLILLDVVMPEMNGFETCRAIRRLQGGEATQILMVTGLDDVESTEQAFDAGANDFISKPINWVMLGYRGQYMLRAGRAFGDLFRSRSRLTKTQEIAKLGNWEIELASNTFICSREAGILLGINKPAEQITYNDFLSPLAGPVRKNVKIEIENAVNDLSSCSLNYQITGPDGTLRYIFNCAEIICDENGMAEVLLGSVQDVTQLREAEAEVRFMAFYDSLTGLANRTLFLDRLNAAILNAKSHNYKVAVLFIELDQFKRINDTFGHFVGDRLLKSVSEALQEGMEKSATISRLVGNKANIVMARLGGDEFAILLPEISKPKNAAIVARRLIEYIPRNYILDGNEVFTTASVGISVFPEDGSAADILLKNAHTAMHFSQNKGSNNCHFYTDSMNIEVIKKLFLEREIHKALEREDFVLYYQPQVEFPTGKIVGAEALIRLNHPEKGIILPEEFIPLAEEAGLVVDINKWVIKSAIRQNKAWQDAGLQKIKMAVNVSAHQFPQQNIIETIKMAVQENQLDIKYFEVEITENVLMQEGDETIAVLQELKDMRVSVSLDDFGTGYSSLSYLMSFPVDAIKIDRSFVMGCAVQPKSLIIIKAIIALGHSLGMKIIAEGIEKEGEFEILKEYGCDEAQGYLLSRPVPPDEFAKMLVSGVL